MAVNADILSYFSISQTSEPVVVYGENTAYEASPSKTKQMNEAKTAGLNR